MNVQAPAHGTGKLLDHGAPAVMLGQLAGRIFSAMEERRYDDAVRLVDEARAQLEQLMVAAWQAKRRAIG